MVLSAYFKQLNVSLRELMTVKMSVARAVGLQDNALKYQP